MPTEEIFTAPLRDGVDGVVYASLPLVHDGNIIDKFRFVVKEGKIVEANAQEGEETLRAAISLDEGAARFGEVALVPYDSPISRQKLARRGLNDSITHVDFMVGTADLRITGRTRDGREADIFIDGNFAL